MKIIENDFSIEENSIVFIGNFDGVHRGHTELVKKSLEIKEKDSGLVTVALSFFPHPKSYLLKEDFKTIFTLEEKAKAFQNLGVDYLKVCNFNDENRNLLPYDFVEKFLFKQLNAKYVVVGSGFNFGRDRSGNLDALKDICKSFGIEVIPVDHLPYNEDLKISSSVIRSLISKGEIEEANNLLGEPYFTFGTVVCGKQLGRTIGFPTANIDVDVQKLLPPKGVYRTETIIDDKKYKSITNVGVNPTFEATKQVIETHIFDFDNDIYGKKITVLFYEFIRPERKFSCIDELKKQIEEDTSKC